MLTTGHKTSVTSTAQPQQPSQLARFNYSTLALGLILSGYSSTHLSAAEQANSSDAEVVRIIGSRSQKVRSVADSPVPVDVITAADLTAMGGTADLTDNLKALIPSFVATPATGDGSAFVRPTSMRGTAPDQVLILVNGKRRHRSALVQFFAPAAGNGAHGPDIGMLPSNALKRIEVLRDGASSQYGSDAIAGVINFVTKDSNSEGSLQAQYGQFFEGEQSVKFAINQGVVLGNDGFLNLSLEYADNEALSRGRQSPSAQALIDAGVQGVGADSPFGDAPLVQSWGRPETDALRFFANAGITTEQGDTLYAQMSYASAMGRYRFFYRAPDHSTLNTLRDEGFTGSQTQTGYTPYLDGDQTDFSLVTGFKGDFDNGTFFDFSLGYGKNELDYYLYNTINAGLGLTSGLQIPQMNFNVGAYEQQEINLNADFSKSLGESFNLAYGAEWREETYSAIAGEVNSYADADGEIGAGASGFKGITPQDSGEFARDNFAVYVDMEQDVSNDLLVQYALRYEDFSDFGGTINGKLATRYHLNDDFSLRGAISTGFHAPTPGQANVRTTITTFDGTTGQQVEEGLVPSTDPRVALVGGKKLTEEKSLNLSLGFTTQMGDNSNLSFDLYQINVDGRIYRTSDIAVPNTTNTISFYTNALDVEHQGFDLVYTVKWSISDSIDSDISFAYNYNKIEVVKQALINGVKPVGDQLIENIENNYPKSRFTLTANTHFTDDFSLMLRANYYGEHYDERGRIGGVGNSAPTAKIDPITFIDAELNYQLTDDFVATLGFVNVFDEYVDEIAAPYDNRVSVGLPYPRRSAANYEGGSWYLGGRYNF